VSDDKGNATASGIVEIDGESLSIEDVVAVARHRVKVRLSSAAKKKMDRCRAVVDLLVESETKVYGLTTGFGSKRDVFIERDEVLELQRNLIMSHAAGVGRPMDEDQARATMLLRANTLAKGVSGVRVEVVETVLAMLNAGVYPYIPEKGSLGASGDLAPLSHLALVLMGHPAGKIYSQVSEEVNTRGFLTIEEPSKSLFEPSTPERLMERFGVEPVVLQAKEGLALNNGTQLMSAIGVLTLADAESLVQTAEIACAASIESIKGVSDAFHERLHAVRPFPGQMNSAENLRRLLEGSDILTRALNMAQVTRAIRLLGEGLESLQQEKDDSYLADASAAFEEAKAALSTIQGDPELVLREQLGLLTDQQRNSLTLRQQQLRAFRQALSPIQETLQAGYRVLLEADLPEEVLPSREAATQALDALEAAVPKYPRVQDNYSTRCMPQVAGAVRQILSHARTNLSIEINSATDNPLIFPPSPQSEDESIESYRSRLTVPECVNSVSSGGNFHGEIVAVTMDYLSMGIAELGNISERRTAQMTDGHLNNGLPSLLIWKSGLNSGFMIPQYTAASLVSENKTLAHPACVDSIPSCENTEDHVSMGCISARKARRILENVEYVVAIELLNAFQALHFRWPFVPGPATQSVFSSLREAGVTLMEEDRPLYPDVELVCHLLRRGTILEQVQEVVGELA